MFSNVLTHFKMPFHLMFFLKQHFCSNIFILTIFDKQNAMLIQKLICQMLAFDECLKHIIYSYAKIWTVGALILKYEKVF